MASFNKVILMGNLTRDPEIRTLPSGVKVCSLGLAVSEVWKDKDGNNQEKVCFVDVEVWNRGTTGRLADLCAQYLAKGRPVLVEGKLEQHEWTSKTGEKRTKLRVRADTVKFVGPRPQDAQAGTAPLSGTAAPSPQPATFAAPPAAVPQPDPVAPATGVADADEEIPF